MSDMQVDCSEAVGNSHLASRARPGLVYALYGWCGPFRDCVVTRVAATRLGNFPHSHPGLAPRAQCAAAAARLVNIFFHQFAD